MSTKERPTTSLCCQSPKNLQTVSTKSNVPAAIRKEPSVKTHSGPKTRITIIYDVGFSNALFLRGQGAKLSWEQGVPLTNVKADEWVWETTEPFTICEFKVLLNDQEYESGQNHTLSCGASIQYTPHFD